ncbi:MAG: hypothetical protein AB8B79_14565 [Granulosicoccus sp.]
MIFSSSKSRATVAALALASSLWCSGSLAQDQDTLARGLLVDMARSQYSVMCQSEVFASCMGFAAQACLDLSESAIEMCLMPLPEEVNLQELDNAALESCPKDIFADAGYSEDKAKMCFDKAMEAEARK